MADLRFRLLAAAALLAIVVGLVLHGAGDVAAADLVWALCVAAMLVPLTWSVVRTVRAGRVGVDAIAVVAMAGALALGEYLAGAVVALMLAGGNALEAAASRRARRELSALLAAAPKRARRRRDGRVEDVAVEALVAGDIAVVRAGEVVPVDGTVLAGHHAIVDEATLTGESLPVARPAGAQVLSGTVNAGEPFELRATSAASESAYAALVRLVDAAQRERAPFVRLADRYAALLLPATLLVSGAAWIASGDPVRALAVVVVATPCPLILAAPIAFVSGISRAARRGIIVKGASVIERLGRVRSALLDKTGTLTLGTPRILQVIAHDGMREAEVIRYAASLDQLSAHVLAEALVADARGRGVRLGVPEDVHEEPGRGIVGRVDGHRVALGAGEVAQDGSQPGLARIAVAVDGRAVGTIVMADYVRDDAARLVAELRAAGVRHVAMVTGDRTAVAEGIARELGLDRVYAERSPQDKLDAVRAVRTQPELAPVLMVGDGVNDAPALAMADVGIAMGAHAATASSEAADAVIAVDRIDRVAEAVGIGRRSLAIATQSVVAGMGLSGIAMALAAVGLIQPVGGALLQEAIDVAVILNALRARASGRHP